MYDKLAHRIQQMQPAVPFGFISIKPSPVRKSILKRIRRANELIQNLSQKYPNAFFVDVFPTMLDSNGNPRAELFQEDGLHLNRKGYEVWASILEPYRHQIFITRCREILSLQLSSPLGESGIL
jgi:lysophospholipase L1-like esterase